jgi:type II secretory pathway pseudopilin PulG
MVMRRLLVALALLVSLAAVAAAPAAASTRDEKIMARQLQTQMNRVAHQQHDTSFHAIATRCARHSARLFLCEVKTSEPATYGVRLIVDPNDGNVSWKLVSRLR